MGLRIHIWDDPGRQDPNDSIFLNDLLVLTSMPIEELRSLVQLAADLREQIVP